MDVSSRLWADLPILVTFMRADTEVSSRTSSAHEPGGATRAAILALLCARVPKPCIAAIRWRFEEPGKKTKAPLPPWIVSNTLDETLDPA